jgi:hypothetical protein
MVQTLSAKEEGMCALLIADDSLAAVQLKKLFNSARTRYIALNLRASKRSPLYDRTGQEDGL